jgi:nitrate reductase beta subunit
MPVLTIGGDCGLLNNPKFEYLPYSIHLFFSKTFMLYLISICDPSSTPAGVHNQFLQIIVVWEKCALFLLIV